MAITVELTYEMGKAAGERRFEIPHAVSVSDVLKLTEARLSEKGVEFDELSRRAAVAVNGVLVNHKRGMSTAVADGDRVTFVKAAAGG